MNGQALRIFAHASVRVGLQRPRRAVLHTPLHLVQVVEGELEIDEPGDDDDTSIDVATEERILDILSSAPQFGETIDIAYRRKEQELALVFRSLGRIDAAALHKRLSDPHADDAVATRFSRLVVERRTRLLAVLADAPRREARSARR